jgi:hypothetical protein
MLESERGGMARGGIDRRRLLVYGIDLVRESGNHHRALAE